MDARPAARIVDPLPPLRARVVPNLDTEPSPLLDAIRAYLDRVS